jgi:hypothetical protein
MQRIMNPQNAEMLAWLSALSNPRRDDRLSDPVLRDARTVCGRTLSIRARGRRVLVNDHGPDKGNLNRLRQTAEDILARHPSVSTAAMAHLSVALAPDIEGRRQFSASFDALESMLPVMNMMLVALGVGVAFVANIVSAIAKPGGIAAHTVGLGVVTREGREIGRGRSLLRALVVWAPAIAWFVYLAMSPKVQGFVPNPPNPTRGTLLVLGTMALGAIWTVVRTTRGPHDFVAGMWVVRR